MDEKMLLGKSNTTITTYVKPPSTLATDVGLRYLIHRTKPDYLKNILQTGRLQSKAKLLQSTSTATTAVTKGAFDDPDAATDVVYIAGLCDRDMSDRRLAWLTAEIYVGTEDEDEGVTDRVVLLFDLSALDKRKDWFASTTWRHKGRYVKNASFRSDEFKGWVDAVKADPKIVCPATEFLFPDEFDFKGGGEGGSLRYILVGKHKYDEVKALLPEKYQAILVTPTTFQITTTKGGGRGRTTLIKSTSTTAKSKSKSAVVDVFWTERTAYQTLINPKTQHVKRRGGVRQVPICVQLADVEYCLGQECQPSNGGDGGGGLEITDGNRSISSDGFTFVFNGRYHHHNRYGKTTHTDDVWVSITPLDVYVSSEDCDLQSSAYEQRMNCSKVTTKKFEKHAANARKWGSGRLRGLTVAFINSWICNGKSSGYGRKQRSRRVRLGILVTKRPPGGELSMSLESYVARYGWSDELAEVVQELIRSWWLTGWNNRNLWAPFISIEFTTNDGDDGMPLTPPTPVSAISVDISDVKHQTSDDTADRFTNLQNSLQLDLRVRFRRSRAMDVIGDVPGEGGPDSTIAILRRASSDMSDLVELAFDTTDVDELGDVVDPFVIENNDSIHELVEQTVQRLRGGMGRSAVDLNSELISFQRWYRNMPLYYKILGNIEEQDEDERPSEAEVVERVADVQQEFLGMISDALKEESRG